MPSSPQRAAARRETPTTARKIRNALTRDWYVVVRRGGEEFYIAEDEDVTGWYAWRVPVEEGARAVHGFGECDYRDEQMYEPDYRALSERIATWAAGGSDASH